MTDVVIPLSKTGIALGSILVFTQVMGDYFVVRQMSGGQSASIVSMLSTEIQAMQYPPAAANAVVLVVFVADHGRRHDAHRRRAEGTGEMMVGGQTMRPISASRPWTFYALGGSVLRLSAVPLWADVRHLRAVVPGRERRRHLPDGRHSTVWFEEIMNPARWRTFRWRSDARSARGRGQSASPWSSRSRPGWAFGGNFPGSGVVFYIAVASLVMPRLLVGFGIGLSFQFLGLTPVCSPPPWARN